MSLFSCLFASSQYSANQVDVSQGWLGWPGSSDWALMQKRGRYTRWMWEQMTEEGYRNTWIWRVNVRKAITQLVEICKSSKGKKESYYFSVSSRMNKENMGLLLNREGDLVPEDIEKTEVMNALFALVLTRSHRLLCLETGFRRRGATSSGTRAIQAGISSEAHVRSQMDCIQALWERRLLSLQLSSVFVISYKLYREGQRWLWKANGAPIFKKGKGTIWWKMDK